MINRRFSVIIYLVAIYLLSGCGKPNNKSTNQEGVKKSTTIITGDACKNSLLIGDWVVNSSTLKLKSNCSFIESKCGTEGTFSENTANNNPTLNLNVFKATSTTNGCKDIGTVYSCSYSLNGVQLILTCDSKTTTYTKS